MLSCGDKPLLKQLKEFNAEVNTPTEITIVVPWTGRWLWKLSAVCLQIEKADAGPGPACVTWILAGGDVREVRQEENVCIKLFLFSV